MSNGQKSGRVSKVFCDQFRYRIITKLSQFWFFLTAVHFIPVFRYLPFVKLTSYSTGQWQVSNDAKLYMEDGAY
jgi:hypothetical protein